LLHKALQKCKYHLYVLTLTLALLSVCVCVCVCVCACVCVCLYVCVTNGHPRLRLSHALNSHARTHPHSHPHPHPHLHPHPHPQPHPQALTQKSPDAAMTSHPQLFVFETSTSGQHSLCRCCRCCFQIAALRTCMHASMPVHAFACSDRDWRF